MTDEYRQLPIKNHLIGALRSDVRNAHARAWQRLARPGEWWTGQERIAIAAEARQATRCSLCACRKKSPSPYAVEGTHDTVAALPASAIEAVHRIRTDPGRLTHSWFSNLIEDGLAEEQYVELVAVIATVVAIDTLYLTLGITPSPLPSAEPGQPSRYRPNARRTDAWVSWLMPEDASEREAFVFPPGRPPANIRRAMSLVPPEVAGFFDLVEAQYLPGSAMRDFSREYRSITHAQIELVAARVSAINRCEY